jgi:hypothetical protein
MELMGSEGVRRIRKKTTIETAANTGTRVKIRLAMYRSRVNTKFILDKGGKARQAGKRTQTFLDLCMGMT